MKKLNNISPFPADLLGTYILINKEPVPCPDLMRWSAWIKSTFDWRRVAETQVEEVRVSTVFLALNHRFFSEGRPILFETMIFGGKHDQHQVRYCTWEKAEKGHQEAISTAISGLSLWPRFCYIGRNLGQALGQEPFPF